MYILITDSFDSLSNRMELMLTGKELLRLNQDKIQDLKSIIITVETTEINIATQEKGIVSLLDNVVFHRRGKLSFLKNNTLYEPDIINFINNENTFLFKAILLILNAENKLIGNYYSAVNNRIYNTYLAQKCGLKIPNTFVFSCRSDLLNYYSSENGMITKPIGDVFRGSINNKPKQGKVFEIREQHFNTIKEKFPPTLFQEKVIREFELRIFVFQNIVYSVAIIVESNIVDYRFVENSNLRLVPYKLPFDLEMKIISLLKELRLDTASFDFIVSPNGEYYFIELNPFGLIHNDSFFEYFNFDKELVTKLSQYEKVY